MIELSIASGIAPSEVEAMGPRGWSTLVDLLSKKDKM